MMIYWGILLSSALIIEAFNIFLRFNEKMTSQNSHIKIMKFLRIKRMPHFHHVFFGLIAAIIAVYLGFDGVFLSICLGVALSDLFHHIFLKILTGDSEFNLFYSNHGKVRRH